MAFGEFLEEEETNYDCIRVRCGQGRDYAGVTCARMTGLNSTVTILHILYLQVYFDKSEWSVARKIADISNFRPIGS